MKPINEIAILNESIVLTENKLAEKLLLANKKMALKNVDIEKRAKELNIANKKLIFKTQEIQLRAAELNILNRDLKKAEENQKEYIRGLEEMMFMISHRVRQPICNILGLSNILDQLINSPEELKIFVDSIKKSALILDAFTRELSTYVSELEQKAQNHL